MFDYFKSLETTNKYALIALVISAFSIFFAFWSFRRTWLKVKFELKQNSSIGFEYIDNYLASFNLDVLNMSDTNFSVYKLVLKINKQEIIGTYDSFLISGLCSQEQVKNISFFPYQSQSFKVNFRFPNLKSDKVKAKFIIYTTRHKFKKTLIIDCKSFFVSKS